MKLFTRRLGLLAALILLVHSLSGVVASAAPTLNYFFPPGATRGAQLDVTASGTFAEWPVSIWVDRAGLEVSCAEEKGKLKVSVAQDAPAGVYLVRLYDKTGAGEVKPFLVGTIPEAVEKETNDQVEQAESSTIPSTINGKLGKSGDVDVFAVTLAKGQRLIASVSAHRAMASPMDAIVQICDADGFVLEQNDDAAGLDPVATFVAPREGSYLVRLFCFPETPNSSIRFAGGDNYLYRLTLATESHWEFALPLAFTRGQETRARRVGYGPGVAAEEVVVQPGADDRRVSVFAADSSGWMEVPVVDIPSIVVPAESDQEQAFAVTLPVVVSGHLAEPAQSDAVEFEAKKGEKISVTVDARDLNFELDPVVSILDAEGKVLTEVDDTSRQRDPVASFTAPADGKYRVVIRDLHDRGGVRYGYRMRLAVTEPDYSLSLGATHFAAEKGKPLEIPVTVARANGMADSISIQLEGLPEGAEAKPVVSEGKGDSAKAVKLQVTGGPAEGWSGPIRVVGQVADKPALKRTASTSIASVPLVDFWLTLPATK